MGPYNKPLFGATNTKGYKCVPGKSGHFPWPTDAIWGLYFSARFVKRKMKKGRRWETWLSRGTACAGSAIVLSSHEGA